MKTPKITVIIPAYNCEKYIGKCIDSILVQSYQDFEILVINDGSTDGTKDILAKYAKEYKNKVVYVEQKNEGVAKTRNKAIKMVKSEYIAFIDCDDFIDSDYLEKLLPDGEDIVMSGYKRPNAAGKIVMRIQLEDASFAKFIVPAPWAKIYNREFLVKNKIEFLDNNIGEDVYFNLIAILSTKKIKITDYVGYNWYFNEKSVSNTKQKSFKNLNIMEFLNSCYDELVRRDLLGDNYHELELFFYRHIVWFLLFSSKGMSKKQINEKYDELFGWLEKRFPDYRKNKLLKGNLPGEIKYFRRIYKGFGALKKLHIDKMAVWLYSKI